jgi:class 3 adenylate cyclase
MAPSRNTSTSELLLQIIELTSLGSLSRSQVARRVRRAFPFARIDRRIDGALEVLMAEGLVEQVQSAGQASVRATKLGLTTLEQNGRRPSQATVLFTDMVGSTNLIDEVGESEAHAIRQRHFTLLRRVIAETDGREVKNLGDGLMVIFSNPAEAISCAAKMQQTVANHQDQIELRVGVHSGELLRDGDDYFGSTVIIARRLCDRAASGQTIVSDFTYERIGDEIDHALESLGALELKGLKAPVPAASVVWREPTEDLVAVS